LRTRYCEDGKVVVQQWEFMVAMSPLSRTKKS
jgi:hypothetical protein